MNTTFSSMETWKHFKHLMVQLSPVAQLGVTIVRSTELRMSRTTTPLAVIGIEHERNVKDFMQVVKDMTASDEKNILPEPLKS